MYGERRRQRVLQDVLVRKPLEINAIAATQNRLLIPLNIPGKTDARSKVVSIEATLQRAIGNARERPLREVLNGAEALAFRAGLDVASDPTCRRCVCSLYLERRR